METTDYELSFLNAGVIGMRMGRQNSQFRNRSGWIAFRSIEQRDAAILILRGRIFSPHPIPLYLEKGEEGKKATGWNWVDMNKVGHSHEAVCRESGS